MHVIFYPHSRGVQNRVNWFDAAFPRHSNIWVDDFEKFASEHGAVGGADVGFGAVVIVNGAANPCPDIRLMNDQIRSFRWVLLVIIGDEGSGFHLEWLDHPKMSVWVYDPKPGKHDKFNRLPAGAIPEIEPFKAKLEGTYKELDWFFSGSKRDIRWDAAIRSLENGKFYSDHLGYDEYARHFAMSKVVPCRATFVGPETCRVYDALEYQCVPIVGTYPCESVCYQCKERPDHPHVNRWWRGYKYDWPHFWEYIFGERPPFPIITEPEELPQAMENTLRDWRTLAPQIFDWWKDYKIKLIKRIQDDAQRLQCS
jgi:hypothetical protein